MSKKKKIQMFVKSRIEGYGNKCYYNDKGQLHREDGPAVEYTNGDRSFYIHGQIYSRKLFYKYQKDQ